MVPVTAPRQLLSLTSGEVSYQLVCPQSGVTSKP
jgi:hypothetical protein